MLNSHFTLDASTHILNQTYLNFKSSRKLYEDLHANEKALNLLTIDFMPSSVTTHSASSLKSMASSLVSILTAPHQLARRACAFDLFELKVIKQVLEQALSQLKAQGTGEAESVKKYRFQKTNGLKIEQGTGEYEINEMLKGLVGSIAGDQFSDTIVNEVILTALITVEK